MSTNAKIGHGNLLQIFDADGSPPTWKTVAEVTNITPPSLSREAQDATHTESDEGWREYIPGLKDGGEVSAELNLVPDSDTTALLLAQFDKDDLTQARILFNDGNPDTSPPTCSVWSFSAVVTGLPTEAPVEGKMTATVTLKISGKPSFTRATA